MSTPRIVTRFTRAFGIEHPVACASVALVAGAASRLQAGGTVASE